MSELRDDRHEDEAVARRDRARIAALHATGLLDSDVEEVFDRLTRLAVRLLRVPAAFISLVDFDRAFYKSTCGFGEPLASNREMSGPTFCHFTIQRTAPLVIPDTAADSVYRDLPIVRTLGVAAYVGIPIALGGHAIGALGAVDLHPREWTDDEVDTLVELAAATQREIELRGALAARKAATEQSEANALQFEAQAEALEVNNRRLLVEAQEARAMAENASSVKMEFLSTMSHELRTPLNAISGFSQLLEMGVRGAVSDSQREDLGRIIRAAHHLQSLINDVLNYARLDAGKVQYERRPVALDALLDDVEQMIMPQLSNRGLIYNRGAASLPDCAVVADEEKVRQVLVNLLTNAVKFTPPGGSVTLDCEKDDAVVRVFVADTGRGIPDSQRDAVFDPFVQVNRGATGGSQQGVGLGLAISRNLARGMQGDLIVRSTPGAGSTFVLSLPAA